MSPSSTPNESSSSYDRVLPVGNLPRDPSHRVLIFRQTGQETLRETKMSRRAELISDRATRNPPPIASRTPGSTNHTHTHKNQRKSKKLEISGTRGHAWVGEGGEEEEEEQRGGERPLAHRRLASLRFTLRSTTSDEFVALCAGDESPFKTGRGQETRALGPRGCDTATWTSGRPRLDPVHVAVSQWATPADLTWCGSGDEGLCRPMGRSACSKGWDLVCPLNGGHVE